MTKDKYRPFDGTDTTDVQTLDWHSLISHLTGQALLALGQGTKLRNIVLIIAQGALHWQEGQRRKR